MSTNVEVYNLAISDSSGVVSYKRDAKRPCAGLYMQEFTRDEESMGLVSVNSVTLDEFLKSREIFPDVIKIDVEGAEMSVLMGMRQTLRIHKPILFLEFHPDNLHYFNTSLSAILSLLIENDYKVFSIESMRSQKSKGRLKPIYQDSMIEGNVMLYATAVGES